MKGLTLTELVVLVMLIILIPVILIGMAVFCKWCWLYLFA